MTTGDNFTRTSCQGKLIGLTGDTHGLWKPRVVGSPHSFLNWMTSHLSSNSLVSPDSWAILVVSLIAVLSLSGNVQDVSTITKRAKVIFIWLVNR